MLLKEGIIRMKENVNDARTLLGGSDVDWGPSRSGSGPAAAGLARMAVLSSEMSSALCVCTAMLNKYYLSTSLEMICLLTKLDMLKEGSRSVSQP